jgi:hypothetical protein
MAMTDLVVGRGRGVAEKVGVAASEDRILYVTEM